MKRLALVLLLLYATPAEASTLSRFERLGDKVFGTAPCGQVRTVWQLGTGNQEDAAGWTDPENCTIYLSTLERHTPAPFLCEEWLHERGHIARYNNPTGVKIFDPNTLEPVLNPDGTQAIDHDHSPNPRSIMYPYAREQLSGWEGRGRHRRYVYHVDRRCKQFAPKRRAHRNRRAAVGRI